MKNSCNQFVPFFQAKSMKFIGHKLNVEIELPQLILSFFIKESAFSPILRLFVAFEVRERNP